MNCFTLFYKHKSNMVKTKQIKGQEECCSYYFLYFSLPACSTGLSGCLVVISYQLIDQYFQAESDHQVDENLLF